MILRVHTFDHALHHALTVDEERLAEGAHVGASVELLLCPDAELSLQRGVRVGDEPEGQALLFKNPRCERALSLLTPMTS